MDLMATVGQCDNGYACVYQNNLSWSSRPRRCLRKRIRGSYSKPCSAKEAALASVERP